MSISERAMALWIELQIRMGMFSLKFCAPRKYSTIECYTKPSWPFVQFEDWKSAIGQRRILYIRTLTLLLGFIVLILILPLSYVFSSLNQKAHIDYGFTKDAVGHFVGGAECGISQSNIYGSSSLIKKGSPMFCKKRKDLLEALSESGRHGYDEPFVGKGCTYKWFTTPEICMILERFSAVTFIGDGLVQDIYTAFNILLREDFSLGGLYQSKMSPTEYKSCNCENQFHSKQCKQKFFLRSHLDAIEDAHISGNAPFCNRIPHAYVAIYSSPTTVDAFSTFKSLTYSKPNPWQPSPVIHSLTLSGGINTDLATQSLQEWLNYASGAERNIPFLSLRPMAAAVGGGELPNDNNEIWRLSMNMEKFAKENNVDFLGLYNLTVQAESQNGIGFGMKVAVVQAMMIVNWLSKLPTS